MAVTHIEGFDWQQPKFSFAYGVDDPSYYWVPWSHYEYIDGAIEGRALKDRSGMKYHMFSGSMTPNSRLPRGGTFYVYWAMRYSGLVDNPGSSYWNPFLYFDYGAGEDHWFGIEQHTDGRLRLASGEVAPGPQFQTPTRVVLSSPFMPSFTEDDGPNGELWSYYRFSFNPGTGAMELRQNGNVVLQGNIDFGVNASYNWECAWNRSNGYAAILDHIVFTDAPLVAGSPSPAVQVTAGADGWDAPSLASFAGVLIMGGLRYQAEWVNVPIGANDLFTTYNLTRELNYVFPLDPRDDSPWTQQKLSEITSWGLCAKMNTPSKEGGPEYYRITSLFFQHIDMTVKTFDAPIIRTTKPGNLTFFNGDFLKVDFYTSYGDQLDELPRNPDYLTDKYIKSNRSGCLQFVGADRPFIWTGITFAQEYREDFLDWYQLQNGGVNFKSWFISGYSVLGEGNKAFQNNYVTVNYQQTVNSGGAYLQPIWDYAIDPESGRWGSKEQIYRNDPQYKHLTRKMKARGHGKSLQFKISSEDQKDFIINGWGCFVLGNQLP